MVNDTVVVTGASAGVGRATVRAFARRGARIGLLARGDDGLEATRREVEAAGAAALVLPTDVADAEQVEQAAERVEEAFGPIDVWVNNAMVSVFARFTDIAPEEYRRVTDVTYHGTVHGTLAALRRMTPRDHGRIVQVGSALAFRGIPLQSAYCGAKHAIQGFSESVRTELRHDGSSVTIGLVHLPALNTPQFQWVRNRLPHEAQPVPPIYQPELAADAILYAADHGTRELFVGGPTLLTVWGSRIVPGLVDRYLAWTGFSDQQTSEPAEERDDNLFDPLAGDHGAHGVFDERANEHSLQWELRRHSGLTGLAAGLTALARVGDALGIRLRQGHQGPT